MRGHKLSLPVLTFILCSLSTIGSGFLFFGPQIFHPDLIYFQFVMFGPLVGAMIASSLLLRSRWLILIGALATFIMVLQTGSQTPAMLLRDAVWVAGLSVGVKIGLSSEDLFADCGRGKFLVWAVIYAGVYTVALFFLVLLKTQALTVNPGFLLRNIEVGALLGTGLGIGRWGACLIQARIEDLPSP